METLMKNETQTPKAFLIEIVDRLKTISQDNGDLIMAMSNKIDFILGGNDANKDTPENKLPKPNNISADVFDKICLIESQIIQLREINNRLSKIV